MINVGDYILITSEEYSDYGVVAFTRCVKEFDAEQIKTEYLADFPNQKKNYGCDWNKVNDWLINRGYLKKLEYRELHLGTYHNLEPTMG